MESDIINNIERLLSKDEEINHKAHQMLKKFDLDDRGYIQRHEFIGLLCDLHDKTLVLQAFNILDFDGNGLISPADFDTYFKCQGYENLDSIMDGLYENNFLNFEDFYTLVSKFVAN